MARLRYLSSAEADIVGIFKYITRESGSMVIGNKFLAALRKRCRYLAGLPGEMGRARPELGPGYRSSAYRGYIIFFRYAGNEFQIVNILEGHRDAEKYFGIDIDPDDED